MTRARLLAALTVLTLALAATIAVAAPDRTTQVSASAPAFAWDGPVSSSLSPAPSQDTCTKPLPGRFCDETLLEVKEAGKLAVTIDGWNEDSDLDLFLFTSDAEGTMGEEIVNALNSGPGPEKISSTVQPGFYLVFVNYFQAINSGYQGSLTFASSGAPAPEPSPDPGSPSPEPGGPSQPGPLAPSGKLEAEVSLSAASLGSVRKKGAPLSLSCTVRCKASLTLKAGKRKVATGSVTAESKQQAFRLKLTRKGAKKLRKARRAKLTLTAVVTDEQGGQRQTLTARRTYKR